MHDQKATEHKEAIRKLLKRAVISYKATEMPMIVLSALAVIWTVIALAKNFPRDLTVSTAALLYSFVGMGMWSRMIAARRVNNLIQLYSIAEHIGELPLTPTGLVDWARVSEMVSERRYVLPDKMYLAMQRFLARCEFNFERLLFLTPEWCVWM